MMSYKLRALAMATLFGLLACGAEPARTDGTSSPGQETSANSDAPLRADGRPDGWDEAAAIQQVQDRLGSHHHSGQACSARYNFIIYGFNDIRVERPDLVRVRGDIEVVNIGEQDHRYGPYQSICYNDVIDPYEGLWPIGESKRGQVEATFERWASGAWMLADDAQ